MKVACWSSALLGGVFVLAGCSGKPAPDVSVGRITRGRVQYVVAAKSGQSIIREYDLRLKRVVSEFIVSADVVEIIPQSEGMCVMVSTTTPSGRSTIQPHSLNPATGTVAPIFPVDESFRYPALHIGDHLIYNRRTQYLGAMGGQPWKLDRQLWISERGVERPLGVSAFITDDFHSTGDAPFAIVSEYHDFGTSRVRLLTPSGRFHRGIDLVREVGNLALSKKGRYLAVGTFFDPKVEVIDTDSGKVYASHKLKGRCVALLFDETDELWAVMQQAGQPAYLWRCEPGGPVEVAKLP